MEYKRLGEYIEPVDERNSKLEIKLSQGICNEKYFQDPRQVAENSAADKIVRRGYFAYNRATTRNGEKISIAYREGPDCTVSSAYQVFRIKDEEKLNPKYLLMWYKRPDFDKYARFKSHGSAHEFFEYEEMCNVRIPLPSIERQREIVSEYETLTNRICLNNQMIQHLEATAQALYRKTFVDNIDKENLPEGWRMGTIGELFELQRGFDLPSQDRKDGEYPIYASTGIAEYHNQYKVDAPCVVTGRSGTIGEVFYVDKKSWPLNTTLWVKDFKGTPSFFVYYKLKELELGKTVSGFAAVPTLNRNDVHMMESTVPPIEILIEFENEMIDLHHHKTILEQENFKLTELQSLLLAKMGH